MPIPNNGYTHFWLVLDMHGVLIPSSERWILSQLAKETNQPWLSIYLRWLLYFPAVQRGKISARKFYEHVLNQKLTEKQFQEMVMKKYAQRGEIPKRVLEQLKALKKKGWKLGILSDMNSAQAEFHRKKNHFALFDLVYLSCETGLMKPFPDVYTAFEKRLRTRKDYIVFVDDLWFNSLSAQIQGWHSITLHGEKQLVRFLKDLE